MPLKRFCDRCDSHIPDEAPVYTASFNVKADGRNDHWTGRYNDSRLLVGSNRKLIDPVLGYEMICKKCATSIAAAMLPPESDASDH